MTTSNGNGNGSKNIAGLITERPTEIQRLLGGIRSRERKPISDAIALYRPAEVLAGVEASLSSCGMRGKKPQYEKRLSFPESGGIRVEIVGVRWEPAPGKLLEGARIVAGAWMAAPLLLITRAFVKMKVFAVNGNRPITGDDMKMELEFWTERLQEYPGDVVLCALEQMSRRKFWPAWDEIEAAMEPLLTERRALADHILMLEKRGNLPPNGHFEEPSLEEDKHRRAAIADEMLKSYYEDLYKKLETDGLPHPSRKARAHRTEETEKEEANVAIRAMSCGPRRRYKLSKATLKALTAKGYILNATPLVSGDCPEAVKPNAHAGPNSDPVAQEDTPVPTVNREAEK